MTANTQTDEIEFLNSFEKNDLDIGLILFPAVNIAGLICSYSAMKNPSCGWHEDTDMDL